MASPDRYIDRRGFIIACAGLVLTGCDQNPKFIFNEDKYNRSELHFPNGVQNPGNGTLIHIAKEGALAAARRIASKADQNPFRISYIIDTSRFPQTVVVGGIGLTTEANSRLTWNSVARLGSLNGVHTFKLEWVDWTFRSAEWNGKRVPTNVIY